MPDSDSILEELASFPIPIEMRGRRSADGATPTGTDAAAVQDALSETLGWRLRDRDPKGFRAALAQSFELAVIDGRREWRWRPRTVNVQADLGAVTGAQASICARAKSSVDGALAILERLTALAPVGDSELMHASRSIVRLKLNELVRELGQESGPRVTRVDAIFDTLVGERPAPAGSTLEPVGWHKVGGELGRLRRRFGFSEAGVNTVKEETLLTDFILLVDHVSSLHGSWAAVRGHFDRLTVGSDRYFGTQLVVISRLLNVVAENVDGVTAALDSVLLGEGERETIEVKFPVADDHDLTDASAGAEPAEVQALSLAEGLHWIEDLTEDAARLVEEAGREALPALASTVERLADFVAAASLNKKVGGRSRRVRRALDDLDQSLEALGAGIRLVVPQGFTITGADLFQGDPRALLIQGTDFAQPDLVQIRTESSPADPGGWTNSGHVLLLSERAMLASFSEPVAGPYTLRVTIDGETRSFTDTTPRTMPLVNEEELNA